MKLMQAEMAKEMKTVVVVKHEGALLVNSAVQRT